MNELLNAAKDQAAREAGFRHWVDCESDVWINPKIIDRAMEIYASQQRIEGIREGFEAARTIWAHQDQNVECPVYPTADDYLNTKI